MEGQFFARTRQPIQSLTLLGQQGLEFPSSLKRQLKELQATRHIAKVVRQILLLSCRSVLRGYALGRWSMVATKHIGGKSAM